MTLTSHAELSRWSAQSLDSRELQSSDLLLWWRTLEMFLQPLLQRRIGGQLSQISRGGGG